MKSGTVGTTKSKARRIPWLLAGIVAMLIGAVIGPVAPAAAEDDGTQFTVVIENVSDDGTLTTPDGTVAVPLSPGAYLVRSAGRNSLLDPRDAATSALEALAEDGDPSGLPAAVPGSKIFDTPDGADGPGPIFPGDSYSFSFEAEPGDELSLVTMFVQSNDWFYSTLSDVRGIALFDDAEHPISGDVTDQLKLWESKTELDETPGTGPNQAPRQSGPNTGVTESGQVISLSTQGIHPPLNGPVIKVTITAESEDPDDGDDDGDDDGEDPDDDDGARPGEPFDAADGMVIGRTGTLNGLNGINVGPDGKVYNASVGGSEITVHDPETGEILDRIGQERGVNGPDDLFITADGTIYWTEILAGNVGMLKPDGTVKKQFVGPGVNPITMSDDGRLFVARIFLGDGLYELDPELEADPVALDPNLVGLNGFDFGPDGLLYAPLFFVGDIVRIDVDASPPVPETVASGLMVPSAVAFNSAGELHASEIAGGRILEVDITTGDVEVLTQVDGTIDNLAFDASDRLFFAAGADNQIIRLTPEGDIEVFGEIALGLPGGVAVSPDGTAWVADLFVLRGYRDGEDPAVSFYERFAPPGTAFGGANTVFADGDLLVTATTFGNNVQILNPATGEVLEDYRNLAGPTNAIIHGDRLVASQLGATPGAGSVVDARTGDVLVEGLPTPVGLASDGSTLYVSDWATGTVTAVSDGGSTVIASGLNGPEGLAVDGNRLLVVEEGLDQVSAIDLTSGEVTPVIQGLDLAPPPLEGFAPFGSITGVAIGDDGAIYVSQDNEVNALLKFGGEAPPEPPAPQLGFVDTLIADGRFTTLLAAINASFLQPPPPDEKFTLLAPTDEAFAALPDGLLDDLLADPGFLTDTLLYHLIEGEVPAETVVTLSEARTLLGAPLGIEVIDGQVVLNGETTVIETDLATAEGVIHVIDGVLLPPPPPEPLGFLVADYARGSTQVPDPGDPDALSAAFVDVYDHGDEGTLEVCVFVNTTIQDPTMAHIHRGAAGVAGPVVVDFGFTAESWNQDQLNPVERTAEGCVDVAAELAEEIIADPGAFYANVHSVRFAAGANREQFLDAEGLNEFPRAFTAAPLRGANVVPGPGDPDSGRGFVDFNLPLTDTGEICYVSVVYRVDEITSGHIHIGAAGESGDVLVDLEYGTRWELRTHPSGQGFVVLGCATITADALAMIEADPAGFYVNLHNEAFPGGAVRAQMVAGVGEVIRLADLASADGQQANDLFGFADMALFPTQELLCWDAPNAGIGMPTGVSISDGSGVVISFDLATHPMLGDVVDPFVEFTSFGCQTVAADILQGLVDNPNNYTLSMDSASGSLTGVVFDPEFGPQPPSGGGELIEGSVTGVHSIDEAAPDCDGEALWRFNSSGTGEMSLLGSVDYELTQCTYFDPATEGFVFDNGTITFTAADGETLVIAQTGSSAGVEGAAGLAGFTVEGTWEAVGGTGRFTDATGAGAMDGVGDIPGGDALFDLPDGLAMFNFIGEIFFAEPPPEEEMINLQILAINDFHGNIATTSSAFGGVGRADYLAANMAAAEAEADNSIIVSAGDLVGASPLISALFHDEPTIEAMNLIGLAINGVGNHEFDEGADELIRLQNGGSHPVDGDLDGDGFEGADFEFLAANVVDDATGETIFAPYTVREYEGVGVAFIGMTLEGTPSIVTPSGVAGLTFNDEIDTVNALIPEIQAEGIEAIVVLLHEGGIASEGGGDGDGCGTLSGPLNDIVLGLDDAVDLVIGGHNNQRFVCPDVGGKAVTMAYWSGRMFTDIDTVLDPVTGDMTVVSLDNKENFQDGVTPDADLTALIDRYDGFSAPLANRVIGTISTDITEENNNAGESALGDVIADAQLAATSSADTGNAVVAFMNPGGIRDDFFSADVEGGEAPGEVTYGEAFSVQPFGNSLVTMTLTGEQIHTLLTQQWVGQDPDRPRILQVSEGFSYTWDADAANETRVDPTSIMIDGVMVDPAGEYRVTVNSFLADGGDNFAVLKDGTDRLGGEIDLDALVVYFEANSPIEPGPQDRITVTGGAGNAT